MVSSELAVVAVCAVLLVAMFGAALVAGWGARGRVADADLALEQRLHAEQRDRAERAEKDAKVLAHVAQEYLAAVPAGGRVDRARLRVLLDSTAYALGSPAPGPPAPGVVGAGGGVDGRA